MKNHFVILRVLLAVLMLSMLYCCSKDSTKTVTPPTPTVAPSLANVTTTATTTITATGVTLGGNVTSDGNATVTERGVVYATTQNPTTSNTKVAVGTGTGIFTTNITGLTAGTTYYVRAYATNSLGTAYGSQETFNTILALSLATVTTTPASTITSTGAALGGNVTSDGNATVTERGVVYATTQTPTISNTKVAVGTGTGSFTTNVTGLTAGKTYYVRAYATNSQGTAYGSQEAFNTTLALSIPTVTTTAATNIASTRATLGGQVTSDVNTLTTERGVVYATTQIPTTANIKVVSGAWTDGSFTVDITGLTPLTTYYVRAYATNSQGTAYGSQVTFNTTVGLLLPTVTTSAASTITTTAAILGGNAISDGNTTVSERGVVYATTQNPTTANNKWTIGTGTGSFSASVSELTSGTTYYVRAYATNSQGTAYGSQVIFNTVNILPPTLTTTPITSIISTTASSGGNITSDGGAKIDIAGVCWSKTPNPTIYDSRVANFSGMTIFTSLITGLNLNTKYYVRAYASNSAGVAYGNELSFTSSTNINSTPVTDIEGNVYKTVQIGKQVWMAENLKTTKLRDGTIITLEPDNLIWSWTGYPGWPRCCWFNNDINNKSTYGALYNWYVVNTGKLCPTGWSVPIDSDWDTLATYLGGGNIAGGKLKESGTIHWLSPNLGATNETGFTALPGGYRTDNGSFFNRTYSGYWWSIDQYTNYQADLRYIPYDGSNMTFNAFNKFYGLSVRCIKD